MKRRVRTWCGWGLVTAAAMALGWRTVAGSPGQTPPTVTVMVVNPLDQPVSVRFGDREVTVGAGSRADAYVLAGPNDVEVRSAGGSVLDRHHVYVADGGGKTVYSVLGAAPIYSVAVTYTSTSLPADHAPPPASPQPMVGERLLQLHGDYLFVPPPEHLQMKSGEDHVTKSYVDLAHGGWRTGLSMAFDVQGGLVTACTLARRLHGALPGDGPVLSAALDCAEDLDGADAAAALAEEATTAQPGSLLAHRFWLHTLRAAGRLPEARQRYQRLAAEQPNLALAAAMRLRTVPRDEAESEARAAADRFPGERDVLRSAGYLLLALGRPDEAAAVLARIPLGAPADNGYVDPLTRALARTGRAREAAALALAAAQVKDADTTDLALYARAARLPGAQPAIAPEELIRTWAGDKPDGAWVRAVIGDLEPAQASAVDASRRDVAALSIVAWATRDPAKALDLCEAGGHAVRMQLPPDVAALLALEAYRVGARDLFQQLRRALPVSAAEVAAWVDGGVEPAEAWRFDDDERAAFALVRERHLQALGQPVPPALSQGARGDPLQGVATLAARRWPAAAPGSSAIRLVLQPQGAP